MLIALMSTATLFPADFPLFSPASAKVYRKQEVIPRGQKRCPLPLPRTCFSTLSFSPYISPSSPPSLSVTRCEGRFILFFFKPGISSFKLSCTSTSPLAWDGFVQRLSHTPCLSLANSYWRVFLQSKLRCLAIRILRCIALNFLPP